MKLTPRGEIVFFSMLFSVFVMAITAVVAGVIFLVTHHQVTDQSTCRQTADGIACEWNWVRN